MKLENGRKMLFSYGLVVFGNILGAMAYGLIILPQSFACGGVTGLCVLLNQVVPIPVSALLLAANLCLFALGWFCVGKDFVLKTVVSCIFFPILMGAFQSWNGLSLLAEDPLTSALLGGTLLGVGAGMTLRGNGSSCGFDILGVVLHQKNPKIPVSLVMYLCDVTVILLQAAEKPMLKTVYGILVILISNLIVNKVLTYGKAECRLIIISKQTEAMRWALLGKEDVGLTYLKGETGFQQEETSVALVIAPYEKIESIKKTVYSFDPMAFIIIDQVRSVLGQGYTMERVYQKRTNENGTA